MRLWTSESDGVGDAPLPDSRVLPETKRVHMVVDLPE
jgi:hypothetical protein